MDAERRAATGGACDDNGYDDGAYDDPMGAERGKRPRRHYGLWHGMIAAEGNRERPGGGNRTHIHMSVHISVHMSVRFCCARGIARGTRRITILSKDYNTLSNGIVAYWQIKK